MIKYLTQIIKEVWSILKGMQVTMSYFLSKPVTVEYPDSRIPMTERFRGTVKANPDICISCLYCMNICPVSCITIEGEKAEVPAKVINKEGKEMKRLKDVTRFDVDISRCMQCGLCVEGCPTGAISFSKEYENSALSRDELVCHWVKPR